MCFMIPLFINKDRIYSFKSQSFQYWGKKLFAIDEWLNEACGGRSAWGRRDKSIRQSAESIRAIYMEILNYTYIK